MLEWDAEDGGEGCYWHVCGVCVDRIQGLQVYWVLIFGLYKYQNCLEIK